MYLDEIWIFMKKSKVTILYLIRHCESLPNPDLPERDWPLSSKGELQSIAMVQSLSELKPNRIYSSPYKRAFSSIAPLGNSVKLPVQIDKRLRERKLSKEFISDFFIVMERAWKEFDFALEGGETSNAARTRAFQFINEKCITHSGETIFLCSHGNLIGLVLNSIDKDFGFDQWRQMKTPDVFKLTFTSQLNWDTSFFWKELK